MTKAFGMSVASKPEFSKNSRSLPMFEFADQSVELQSLFIRPHSMHCPDTGPRIKHRYTQYLRAAPDTGVC